MLQAIVRVPVAGLVPVGVWLPPILAAPLAPVRWPWGRSHDVAPAADATLAQLLNAAWGQDA